MRATLGADVQLAVHVGGQRLEAGESGQRTHLGQPVDEHDAVDEIHRLRALLREGDRPPEEAAPGAIRGDLGREGLEQIDLRLLHLLARHGLALATPEHLGVCRVVREALEGGLHGILEVPEHLDLRGRLRVLDQVDDLGNLLAQLGAGIGDVDHAGRDREVRVRRRAEEEPHRLPAAFGAIVPEPRALPRAHTHRRPPLGEALGGGAHAEVVTRIRCT